MLCASPKMLVPLQTAANSGDSACKRGSVKDGFSEILDRSMRSVQRTDMSEKRQSIHSANRAVSSLNAPGQRLKTQSEIGYSDGLVDEKIMPTDREIVSGTENGEQDSGKSADTESTREVSDLEPKQEILMKRIEILQGLLADISALLHMFYQSIAETDSIGENPGSVKLEELKQQILLNLTEAEEFIKASGMPELEQAFADRLLQMLQNGLYEARNAGDEQVLIEFIYDLEALVQKMLSETETIKHRIATEIPSEFTVERTGASNTAEGIEQPEYAESNAIGSEFPAEHAAEIINDDSSKSEAGMRQEQSPMDSQKTFAAAEGDAEHDFAANTVIVQAEIPNAATSVLRTEDKPPVAGLRQTESYEYQIIRQVIEKAETLFSESRTEMVIELKPESIGKLTLRVIHERDGITAGFIAENEQVKAIIESNLRFLEDSLRRSGIELQSLAVSVEQNGQGGQYADNNRSRSGRAIGRKTPAPSTVPTDDIHQTYRFGGTADGLIQMERSAIDLTA